MLSIRPLRWLSAVAVLLVVGHLVGILGEAWFGFSRTSGPLRQFDLNDEANLAAWFFSFLLLMSALVALGLTMASRVQHNHLTVRWAILTGLLALMAIDESAQLHDMATGPLRRGLDIDFGLFYFAWLLPAVSVLIVLAVYFIPLLASLSADAAKRLVVAAAVYFGGAIGVEMISGFVVSSGRQSAPYLAVMTVEEVGELVGALLLLSALLSLLRELRPRLTVYLVGPDVHASMVLDPTRPGLS